jgi:DNA-binding IscR family transcriptional regulator
VSANSRLTVAVHALTWLALAHRRGRERLTSDEVAASINTNPVVVRRSLGDLRNAGLVEVSHGAGASWRISPHRSPETISLRAVLDAVQPEPVFALHHREPNLECPVGRGIRPVLSGVYERATDALKRELELTSIADVLEDTVAARD